MKNFSNTYIFIYVTALVLVIAVVLSAVAIGLKPKQEANKQAEKAQQILKAAGYPDIERTKAVDFFASVAQAKEGQEREMYSIRCADGTNGTVVSLRGKGLWGSIWGYAVLSEDNTTVKGVSFSHKSETPGLGAKITEENFTQSFVGKRLYDKDGNFVSVKVVPKGKGGNIAEENRVDAISGATITSKGVDKMLQELKIEN